MWSWLRSHLSNSHAAAATAILSNSDSSSANSAAESELSRKQNLNPDPQTPTLNSPSHASLHSDVDASSSDDVLKPPSSPPVAGQFWGFTSSDVAADNDPALEDIMQFFFFAHKERESDYTGCVSFELTYPDGRVAIRTVEVKPKQSSHSGHERIQIEEMKETKPKTKVEARVELIPRPIALPISMRSSFLSPARWLHPVCRLATPSRQQSNTDPETLTSTPSDSMPRLHASSRIHVYSGPVPPSVHPTARLLCPRSVFFDVYQGRLDPITSVLTGRAKCPGWRYYELMHFGQCFDMKPETWVRYYEQRALVEEAQNKRLQLTTKSSSE